MVVIGVLLAAAGAVFGLDLLWKNSFRVRTLVVFGESLGISSGRWLFIVGVITGAAVVLGVTLLVAGLGRKSAKAVSARKEHRENRSTRQERDQLRAETDELHRRLEQQQPRIDGPETTGGSRRWVGASKMEQPDDPDSTGRPVTPMW